MAQLFIIPIHYHSVSVLNSKEMRKFVLAFFLLVLFSATIAKPPEAQAQGPNEYLCRWDPNLKSCWPSKANCDANHWIDPFPQGHCVGFTSADTCDGVVANCEPKPVDAGPAPDSPVETCSNGQQGIASAIGCIPVEDTTAFVSFILGWAIGIGGGIAFLLIIYAGFMIMTSSGNPERLKAGQELLTSAIAGLIMLIFSVFILNLIGVRILQIPGFG